MSNVLRLNLGWLDYLLVAIYFVFVIGIGFIARSQISEQPGLLPLRPPTAGLGHRSGVHLGEPRRGRDHGYGRQRRRGRPVDHALLLDRRRAGDAVPRRGDDAVLLRLEGAQRSRIHAQAIRHRRASGERHQLRHCAGADRGRQPVPARHGDQRTGRLAALALADHRGHRRAQLHHARRIVGRDLQRGACSSS